MLWICFIAEMFSTLSVVFSFCRAFVSLCSFGCSLFGFREFNKAHLNGNGCEYNGCVSMRYNSLFISLPLFTKGHKSTFCIFDRTTGNFKIFLSNFDAVLLILFGIRRMWHFVVGEERQRNEQRITHAYTAIVLVAVAVEFAYIKLPKT